MKINRNINRHFKAALITIALSVTSYGLGVQKGEQTILDRWEDRWFESEWYDIKSIEEFLYDTDYSIKLGE